MPKESTLKRTIKSFRKTLKFATSKKVASTELGGSGTPIFSGIIDTGEYVNNLKGDTLIDTINQMRWSDASVNMALLAVTLPILSADWDIKPVSEEPADVEIAEYVKDCLFNKLNWQSTLRQILLMLPYGHFVCEVVYGMEDTDIIWKKWSPRMPKTLRRWNTKKGDLESITQRFYQDGEYKEVELPAEKLLIFVNQKEGDNWLGTSILRQAYKHWFYRDKYYKIDAIATERHGVGIPVITLPEGYTDQDRAEAEELGANLRANEQAYITKPSAGWVIEMLDMKTSTIKDPKEMLNHHTREILKSVLAQFVELGSGSVGSYALVKEQSRFFLDAIDTIATNIESTINEDAIKKLVDLNFTVEEYPKLTHGDLATTDVKELAESIQALGFFGGITPDKELEDYLRTILKLPQLPEGTQREEPNKQPEKEELESDKEKKEKEMSEHKWHRELTKFETKVRFDEILDTMNTEEKKLYTELIKILLKEKAYLLPIFERAIQNRDIATLQRVAGKFSGEYERVFRNGIKKIFEYGKQKASFEIRKPIPSTSPEMTEKLFDRAHFYAQKGYSDLVASLASAASLAILDEAIPAKEGIDSVNKAIKSYMNKNSLAASNLVISENFNEGRKYALEEYKEDTYAYQWSAILDGGTCFPAGTDIMTDKGKRDIKDIKMGDMVLTRNGFKQVVDNGVRDYKGCMVEVISPNGNFICTEEHPVFANGGFKEAKHLVMGDTLLYSNDNIFFKVIDGIYGFFGKSEYLKSIANKVSSFVNIARFIPMPVTAINFYTESEARNVKPLKVYNLQVADEAEYFANGALVHNCNYCRSMDGRTISAIDKKFSTYKPGNVHFGCRCIWVAVLKDEAPLPVFTGIPESLRPQTEMQPWNFEDLNAPLPGSTKIDIQERLYAPIDVGGRTIDYGINTFREKKK